MARIMMRLHFILIQARMARAWTATADNTEKEHKHENIEPDRRSLSIASGHSYVRRSRPRGQTFFGGRARQSEEASANRDRHNERQRRNDAVRPRSSRCQKRRASPLHHPEQGGTQARIHIGERSGQRQARRTDEKISR